MSASYGSSEALALSYHRGPGRAGGAGAMDGPVLSVPDLFLYSMSKPVMMLFPSNRWVQRRFMLRAFTSRISSSGGSGGSGVWWGRGRSEDGSRELVLLSTTRDDQHSAVPLGIGVTCNVPKSPRTLGFGQGDTGGGLEAGLRQ